jgi:hypothetical protein
MSPVGFEPTISAIEQRKTHALDPAATGIDTSMNIEQIFNILTHSWKISWLFLHRPL